MRVRRAGPRDLEVLRGLWEASTAEATFTPYPGTPFEESLATEHVALVAEEAGELVGTAYVNLASESFAYVFGVYVRPDARRRGVATALMRAAAALARDARRGHVVLSVDTPNEQARALYERLGFEDAARLLRIESARLAER